MRPEKSEWHTFGWILVFVGLFLVGAATGKKITEYRMLEQYGEVPVSYEACACEKPIKPADDAETMEKYFQDLNLYLKCVRTYIQKCESDIKTIKLNMIDTAEDMLELMVDTAEDMLDL